MTSSPDGTVTTGVAGGAPHDRDTASTEARVESLSPFDRDVGRLVAGLLDGELERRQPQTLARWSAHVLDQPHSRVRMIAERARGLSLDVAAQVIGRILDRAEHVTGAGGGEGVGWRTIVLPDRPVAVPASVRALIPAGLLTDVAFTIEIDPGPEDFSLIRAVAPTRAAAPVGDLLARLAKDGDLDEHPYRGHVLDVGEADGRLTATAVAAPTDTRDALILPETIWRDIDRNIHRVLANRDLLLQLGLGLNRGVLLHGPPGTGKTQLVRTIVGELAGQVSALLLSTSVMRTQLAAAYRLAEQLAPAIVVLEDADLIIGDRHGRDHKSLADFLTAVDGLISDKTAVFTLATTNDVAALDTAAIRSARIDRIIELPTPTAAARRAIWRHYLQHLPGGFDLDRLAQLTDGASGADIRELVRHAILDTNGQPTTDVLEQLARDRHRSPAHGHYL